MAAAAFIPVLVGIFTPASFFRPSVSESRIDCRKGVGIICADCSAGAALVVNCIVRTVGSGFQSCVLDDFLIECMGMRCVLIGCFHADCAGRHCEGGGCAVCVRKGDASAHYNPLIKHLTGRSRICSQGNRCTFCRFADFSACTDCSFTICYGDVVLSGSRCRCNKGLLYCQIPIVIELNSRIIAIDRSGCYRICKRITCISAKEEANVIGFSLYKFFGRGHLCIRFTIIPSSYSVQNGLTCYAGRQSSGCYNRCSTGNRNCNGYSNRVDCRGRRRCNKGLLYCQIPIVIELNSRIIAIDRSGCYRICKRITCISAKEEANVIGFSLYKFFGRGHLCIRFTIIPSSYSGQNGLTCYAGRQSSGFYNRCSTRCWSSHRDRHSVNSRGGRRRRNCKLCIVVDVVFTVHVNRARCGTVKSGCGIICKFIPTVRFHYDMYFISFSRCKRIRCKHLNSVMIPFCSGYSNVIGV